MRPGVLTRLCGVFLLCLAAGAATAAGLDDFSLIKGIPADATMVANSRDHKGLEFVNARFERVWEAVEKADFPAEIRKLIRSQMENSGEGTEEFDRQWQQLSDLISAVDWSALFKQESAFAMRLPGAPAKGEQFLPPQFVMLMKPEAGKLNECHEGLLGMLMALQKMAPDELTLTESKLGAVDVRKLNFPEPANFGFTLAKGKDTLLIGFGADWVEKCITGMGTPADSIVKTERFKAAFAKLPAPTDALFYIDIRKAMESAKAALPMIDGLQAEAEGGEPGVKVGAMLVKLIDMLDMYEYAASVATTLGMKTTTDDMVLLRDDADKHALYPVLHNRKPVADPFKYVPRSAKEVSVGSGVDLAKLWDVLVEFVKKEVPEGEQAIAQLEQAQAGMGLNIRTDVLSWLEGSYCTFTIPGPHQFSTGETVMMFKVTDEAKASEMVGRLFEAIEPILVQQGGKLGEADVAGTKFQTVGFPLLQMAGLTLPTLGVKNGYMIFASNPKAITAALDVASGSGDNFSKNERYVAEGLPVNKPLDSFSFSDLTDWGKSMASVFGAIPMIMNMAGAGQQIPPQFMTVMSKLGRVFGTMDFYSSSCSISRADGKAIFTSTVLTYREPPTSAKKSDDEANTADEKPAKPGK